MVSSLDFFIAKPDGSVEWMETPDIFEKGITFEEAEKNFEPIDCYIIGARTYEHALELGWPYGDTPIIVLTHRELPRARESVEFYAGDLTDLVEKQLKPKYKNIWLVGGAMLTRDFIRLKLADDIRLMITPILLGEGTPFLEHIGREQPLHLKDVTAFRNGMVGLWYEIRK